MKLLLKKYLVLILLCAVLLTGCANPGGQGQPTAEAEAQKTETPVSYVDSVYDKAAGEGKFCIYFPNATKDYVTDSSVTHCGDSTLLVSPDGKTMLIDMNNIANGSAIVYAMQRLGIDTLDYLVISHPHADHIGSFATIMRYIEIKQVIKNDHDYSADSSIYAAMMDAFEKNNIPITVMYEGDSFSFGEKVQVSVLNPPEEYDFSASTENQNSGSLLMRFEYGKSSYMTGGDIYAWQEGQLIEKYGDVLQADVIKMNHHGRETSNSKEWINTVSCLIAVGEDNAVNSDLVEGRYRLSGAATMYPVLDGAIAVRTDGDGVYEVQVEKERDVDVYGLLSEREGYLNGAFIIG